MKTKRLILAVLAATGLALTATPALAGHHHHNNGYYRAQSYGWYHHHRYYQPGPYYRTYYGGPYYGGPVYSRPVVYTPGPPVVQVGIGW